MSRASSRPRKKRGAAVIAVFLLIAVSLSGAAGVWHPRDLLQQVPAQYVPSELRWLTQPGKVTIPGAFLYQQQRPLSCEYSATMMAARMGGWDVSEYDIGNLVPLSANPHWGYRGNIMGEWGNTNDYGVYNEPLKAAMDTLGIPTTAFYAHGSKEELKHELSLGRPVVVWLAMRGDVNSFDAFTSDGTRYQLTQYMHVMTAYGYDDTGVYLTDPGTAVWRFYTWDEFMAMWNVMDGMALSVHPK